MLVDTAAHVLTVGKHLQYVSQPCLKFIVIFSRNKYRDMVSELLKNFINYGGGTSKWSQI